MQSIKGNHIYVVGPGNSGACLRTSNPFSFHSAMTRGCVHIDIYPFKKCARIATPSHPTRPNRPTHHVAHRSWDVIVAGAGPPTARLKRTRASEPVAFLTHDLADDPTASQALSRTRLYQLKP